MPDFFFSSWRELGVKSRRFGCLLFTLGLSLLLTGCMEPASAIATNSAAAKSFSKGTPDPGLLLLLVPDGQLLTHPQVTAWTDAASEQGYRMQALTDQQFLALGVGALKYGGLILPDQLHAIASDELLLAIRDYTAAGGNTLLVYDFGSYQLDSNQKPTYAIPKSRLSELAGVDYALYDALREKSIVVGPVTAMRSTLRFVAAQTPGAARIPGVGAADAVSASQALVPTTYTPQSSLALTPKGSLRPAVLPVDVLDNYSGYLLRHLNYASFVTRGAFSGKTLAVSPVAGLVAGLHQVGRGQVLFVNLPLTYLKVVRTDALPMHGFLSYFARHVLRLAELSSVPNGVSGLTLNWHLDSFTAQQPTLRLENLGVFKEGPFSIDMTAGPDAIVIGDGKGWDLDNNPVAQGILQRFAKQGHVIGSHGGWNHDYYGLNANETNRATFLPYLQLNADAIKRAISHPLRAYLGFTNPTPLAVPAGWLPLVQKLKAWVDLRFGPPMRQYSPPVGNNPTWAMDWLEEQGVVGVYFGGHTGLGPTRQYREGQLRNPALWVFPVTPAGLYATLEEFQTNHVPKEEVINWYRDSVDFVMNHDTTRMIYMHPNGANVWPDVLQDLLAYAKSQGSEKFKWYTMTRLADFMTTRDAVRWSEQRDAGGVSQFEASHPNNLNEMVWLLPKARYPELPVSQDSSVKVSDRGEQWAVQAGNNRKAKFTARTLPGPD